MVDEGTAHFRVWAPASKSVSVVLAEREVTLKADGDGYHSGLVGEVAAGLTYKYRLEKGIFPDPASRFQPEGPHGPSEIIECKSFRWTDHAWKGSGREGQVVYEMHVGTFTPEGTWRAAAAQLPELARLGVTLIEMMPVADFPGRFGWGYDGVNLFAPTRLYGRPDDLRAFIDRAHALGLGVILDVVYNHLGPDGNYLGEFSPDYFSRRYKNEWGEALNFDGENSRPVREFFIGNAGYWISEFHFDGLRLDATQQIFDSSEVNVMAEISAAVRRAGNGRATFIVAENEPQQARLVRSTASGGYGMDALWNDDFHHVARVALSGRAEAYYSDFAGTPQEFISSIKRGYLFQGQFFAWQKQRRGRAALDLHPANFITFLQNHDQVANSLRGLRLDRQASPGTLRALTALLLLGPNTPMLFQGQEFASSAPFYYFADHHPELAGLVVKGRQEFLKQFPSLAGSETKGIFFRPDDEKTFLRCKLDFSEREKHAEAWALHCDLLQLRREDPVFSAPRAGGVDGAVLSERSFVLRFFGRKNDDRLLLVNLGSDLKMKSAAEPLLAPLDECLWKTVWSSESPRYGGGGTPPIEEAAGWLLPGHSAMVLAPDRNRDELERQFQSELRRRTA